MRSISSVAFQSFKYFVYSAVKQCTNYYRTLAAALENPINQVLGPSVGGRYDLLWLCSAAPTRVEKMSCRTCLTGAASECISSTKSG